MSAVERREFKVRSFYSTGHFEFISLSKTLPMYIQSTNTFTLQSDSHLFYYLALKTKAKQGIEHVQDSGYEYNTQIKLKHLLLADLIASDLSKQQAWQRGKLAYGAALKLVYMSNKDMPTLGAIA